jgi:hypothetical protein
MTRIPIQASRLTLVAKILWAIQILVGLLLVRKWLFVTTYRLYLEDRATNQSGDGVAWQQFNVQENQVVPQIFTDGTAHFSFALNFPRPSALCFSAKGVAPASYEIRVVQNFESQVVLLLPGSILTCGRG